MDGYLLVEFNSEGEGRLKSLQGNPNINYLDFRLNSLDIGVEEGYSLLADQFPKGLRDVLVMAFFTYKSIKCGSGDYFDVDYEDSLTLENHVIVKENYKEFYRKMVSEELKEKDNYLMLLDGDDTYYEELVSHWEDFYNEDFKETPTPEPPSLLG